ncbi:MAG TPA: hypothetical protein VEN81_01865, partial [Planctomycetota bacterium]|nr:hypothetical protein [Planctomycetota bacterium]
MNLLALVSRGLRFHRRTHWGVLAGCALSSAVLSGALFVGDSVKGSLRGIALARLGRIEEALDSGPRTFRDDLAARLGRETAPALRVPGMAIREGPGGRQVNRVDVVGADAAFFALAGGREPLELAPGRVALNGKLAAALGVKVGDEMALRVFRPSLLSREAPLATQKANDRETRRIPLTVQIILPDDQGGRFGLKSDQSVPYNAFVALRELQGVLEMEGQANLIVAAGTDSGALPSRLPGVLTLQDLGLALRPAPGLLQLQSSRIYLDPGTARRALALRPHSIGVLSYMVNEISSAQGRKTPYSFMTALSPGADPALGAVPADMKD